MKKKIEKEKKYVYLCHTFLFWRGVLCFCFRDLLLIVVELKFGGKIREIKD